MKKLLAVVVTTFITFYTWAQAPVGYYSTCEGKSGKTLLTELFKTINEHTTLSYGDLWEVYKTSDVRDNGTIWDTYSTKEWTPGTDQCGSNIGGVGDCYNREHSMPKSWFNDASPMYSDAFHIYPTDGKVNGQRSNYPYGECANGTSLSSSNGVKPLGRLGTSTFEGYNGKVFEPDDEYKGDFARTYFYMATCYNDLISSWTKGYGNDVVAGNDYPCYKTWVLNLFLKWHRQDPVSQKEIDRNNVIYGYQKNRNPYIDHPELVEHIWGDKKSVAWSSTAEDTPVFNTPIDGSTIDFGVTATNINRSIIITVKGSKLTSDATISITGSGFSVSATTLSASSINSENGATLTLNYISPTATSSTGTLKLTSGKTSISVNLTAQAVSGLPATDATNVTVSSFTANWINVNTDDASMKYSINVYKNGEMLSGYPIQVLASLENYNITRLEPETTYTYTVSSPTLVSNTVTVTTATPIPVIELIYDGETQLTTAPDVASEPIEIELYNEYINQNIIVSVTSPFELSSDKSTWTQSISIDPQEDRFYMRLGATQAGTYTTLLNATSGDCSAEAIEFSGLATAATTFIEDFEQYATGFDDYNPQIPYKGTACVWNFSDAGIWTGDSSRDAQSVRFGKTGNSYIEMAENKKLGAGTISFYAKRFGSDTSAKIDVQYSTDNGTTWTTAGTVNVESTTFNEYSVAVNIANDIRIRLQQTSGKRLNIDDIAISNCTASIEDITISSWDTYCRNHQLIIEGNISAGAKVYSLDGILCHTIGKIKGTHALDMPCGLYIVVVGDTARRVLVK